jgi:hypothetical protein
MPYVLHVGKQALQSVWKKTSRKGLQLLMTFSSEEEKLRAERRLRGREQVRKLQAADVVVVSFGKSGRTWLRVMMSRAFQLMHGIPERYLIGFDNLHSMNPAIPKVFFTHDNYIKDYTGHMDSKQDFYDKKVVLLARDPRDVAVSQFFQWKFRMKPGKKALNQYPTGDAEVSMFDFVMNPSAGLGKVIDFMNLWAREAPKVRDFHLLRYEDLRADTQHSLAALLAFMGTPASDEQVRGAVEFASYENMKKMEQKKTFWLSGGRMVPKDRSNPDSYKVRRGKVGGYRDYFEDDQVARIDSLVDETLLPFYGYTSPEGGAVADQAGGESQVGSREA